MPSHFLGSRASAWKCLLGKANTVKNESNAFLFLFLYFIFELMSYTMECPFGQFVSPGLVVSSCPPPSYSRHVGMLEMQLCWASTAQLQPKHCWVISALPAPRTKHSSVSTAGGNELQLRQTQYTRAIKFYTDFR